MNSGWGETDSDYKKNSEKYRELTKKLYNLFIWVAAHEWMHVKTYLKEQQSTTNSQLTQQQREKKE